MSRYERNRKKKSNKSSFLIMPVILAFLLGIFGTFMTLRLFNKNRDTETAALTQGKVAGKTPAAEQLIVKAPLSVESRPGDLLSEKQTVTDPKLLESIKKIVLPDLLSSDELFRNTLTKLSPGLVQWINTDQLIRRYIIIINDFSQGYRVAKHMSFLRHEEAFSVLQGNNVLYIAPKSTARYNMLAQAVKIVDAKAAVAVYQKFKPLMLSVFAEFGYPADITLDGIVKKAAGEILAAPVIEGLIPLERPSLFYKFADPKLEGSNAIQKQMMRMGPENTRIIQEKCREFLVELAKFKG